MLKETRTYKDFDGKERTEDFYFNLSKAELMELAEKCFDEFSADGAPVIIDPVFGDNGKLYGGFDLDYVAAMRKLITRADILLPNVTEACFLAGTAYRENHDGYFVCEH